MKNKFTTYVIISVLLASCSQVTHMQENGELLLNLPYLRAEKGKTWVESPILGARSGSFLGTTCIKHIMKIYNIVYQQLME
jgi:hypothetical protein